jgi:hypothetical protein
MLWLGLALSQQNYSWASYSSLQNILAHYCFGSVRYFEGETAEVVKIRITQRECKLSRVSKDWLLQYFIYI